MIAMSTLLTKQNQESTEKGLEDFADDVRDLLAFSDKPQTYQDIRGHFENDEEYFEEDLGYIKEALDYLKDEEKVKDDIRLDGEVPQDAYSVSDYDAI
jgi:hypothetical protein